MQQPKYPLLTDIRTLWRTIPRIYRNKFVQADIIDLEKWTTQSDLKSEPNKLKITWIGHSTFLIQCDDICGIIDPFWDDFKVAGVCLYKRWVEPAIPLALVPKLNFVCISHNHCDHCDQNALKYFAERDDPLALIPMGDSQLFKSLGFSNILEFKWGQSFKYRNKMKVHFLPACHNADNDSSFGSWLFEFVGVGNIYHAGDTGYGKHFLEIAKKHKIETALLPIAPYTMRDLQQCSHIDQKEAIQAFKDLNAVRFIPMHWGVLPYCDDVFEDTIELLDKSWKTLIGKNDKQKLHIMKIGETLKINISLDPIN